MYIRGFPRASQRNAAHQSRAQQEGDPGDICRPRNSQLGQRLLGIRLSEMMPAHHWKNGIRDFGVANYLSKFDLVHWRVRYLCAA